MAYVYISVCMGYLPGDGAAIPPGLEKKPGLDFAQRTVEHAMSAQGSGSSTGQGSGSCTGSQLHWNSAAAHTPNRCHMHVLTGRISGENRCSTASSAW